MSSRSPESSPLSVATSYKPRVMFVSHNHPEIRPGGAEGYALDVYEGIREAGRVRARASLAQRSTDLDRARYHEGRPITLVNDDPHQYFFYTDMSDWDWVFGRSPKKTALTRFFREFLLEQKPDLVHFQHTLYMGYDILRVTRNTLPDVPIVYTLHEYLPICHHNGQMVRTMDRSSCAHDPRRDAVTSASRASASRRSSCASASSSRRSRPSTCS